MGLLQRVVDESAQSRADFVIRLALASYPKDATAVLTLCLDAVLDVEARADARRRREQLVARTLILVLVPQPVNQPVLQGGVVLKGVEVESQKHVRPHGSARRDAEHSVWAGLLLHH